MTEIDKIVKQLEEDLAKPDIGYVLQTTYILTRERLTALLAHIREQRAALRSCGEALANAAVIMQCVWDDRARIGRWSRQYETLQETSAALALPLVKAAMESK